MNSNRQGFLHSGLKLQFEADKNALPLTKIFLVM